MTAILKSRTPIYVGAWLATAAATFCIGRLTSNTVQIGGGASSKSGNAQATGSSTLGNSTATASQGTPSEDIIARIFGGHTVSLDQVLGGKTLEDHLKNLLKVDDEAVRMLGFLRLLEALNNPDDIKAALELIAKEGGNGRFRVTEQSMLLQKWAQMDPKAAAAFASTQRDFSRFTGMNAVLRTWLKSSPEEAIAWAEANGVQQNQEGDQGRGPGRGGPEDGNWAIATLIGPLAQQDLDRALELAKAQGETRARGRMVDTLVDEMLAQRGLDAARNTLTDMPDDAFRASMAGRLAEKMMANGEAKDTATWASALPAGDTRERAMAEVIRRWADNNPAEAGAYLQQLGSSPDWNQSIGAYAREIAREHPNDAFVWANTISDPQQRERTMAGLLNDFRRRNPNNADAAVQIANQYGIQMTNQAPGGFGGGGRFRGGGGDGGGGAGGGGGGRR